MYINDDAIGAAGGAESAYLITNEITRLPGQRVFATFDVYFLSRLNHALALMVA